MKRAECQTQLDLIKSVHERHLQWGYKCLNHLSCSEDDIKVIYTIEWRGRYGFIPGIDIYHPEFMNGEYPVSAMSPLGAYKYIIAGMFRYADVSIACKGYYYDG